ncbi:hypothetical protein K438DRAFT_484412 [Mycena galopus ATCC 62051]|nr:hypothetical protein K438DRAFT_484412 [Mycena galopus ATCC 62051]
MSTRKDRFCAIFIYKTPPHLSRKEFEAKMSALIDEALLLPIVKQNVLKVDMIFRNDLLDDHIKVWNYVPAEPVLLVTAETETPDHFLAMLEDATVQKIVANIQESGLLSDSHSFCMDVLPKIDNPTPASGIHTIGIYQTPPNLPAEKFSQKFLAFIDKWIAHPAVKKNLVNYELWMNNSMFIDHMRAFGFSTPEFTCVRRANSKTLDDVKEMIQDSDTQKTILNANDDFGLNQAACFFAADVVTKVDKS